MALGFLLEDGLGFVDGTTTSSTRVTPDKTMARNITPRVIQAQFGDGFEQRIIDGINNINEEYSVSFNSRSKQEINAIISTFNTRAGVTAFDFTIPTTAANGSDSETTIKVICSTYNQSYDSDGFYSCSATFKRVYES